MLVDDSLTFINVRTGRYPLTLDDIREELTTLSLSRRPHYSQLKQRGYWLVKPTPRPDGITVKEGSPEPGDDGFYYQQWLILESATQESDGVLRTFKNQATINLKRQYRALFANGYTTCFDTDTLHVPLDNQSRLYLLELMVWVNGLGDDDVSMVQIPTKESVFETCSVLEAKTVLSEIQDYCRRIEVNYLALKKQVICADEIDELPAIYDNTLESSLQGV